MIFLIGQDVLLYFAFKYEGDWDLIYQAIKNKEKIDEKALNLYKENMKYKYITLLDEKYPICLKNSFKPPFVLFYYGDITLLSSSHKITVVGSRNCTKYGEEVTRTICAELSKKSYVIVSGMARGIDSIAHKSAINVNGKTIAVLGSGINYCYPKQNKFLYEIMKKEHLILSEYPDNLIARKENFPQRNRIIAAIGDGVFIPECQKSSGTSITISYALNLGKEVFCVPFPINISNGNNKLIKDGAILVETSIDIINEL